MKEIIYMKCNKCGHESGSLAHPRPVWGMGRCPDCNELCSIHTAEHVINLIERVKK